MAKDPRIDVDRLSRFQDDIDSLRAQTIIRDGKAFTSASPGPVAFPPRRQEPDDTGEPTQ